MRFRIARSLLMLGAACSFFGVACTRSRPELGTVENPIKFYFVPSVESTVLESSAQALRTYLEKRTPYKFKIAIPTSYISVVEAFGAGRADVASLNTFGYVLARRKYQVEALLTVIRNGESTYRSQILARADGGINKIEDINGKRFAYVDPTSTSGYLMPLKLFKDKNIKPKVTTFAQRHDNVISMIYQGQVDAGATYYSRPLNGEIQDARMLVKTQYPDIENKVKIVLLTDPIPNDPIVFRKDLLAEMKRQIVDGMVEFLKTPEGKSAFEKTFSVSGMQPTTDKEYDAAMRMVEELGRNAESIDKPAGNP